MRRVSVFRPGAPLRLTTGYCLLPTAYCLLPSLLVGNFRHGAAHAPVDADDGVDLLLGLGVVGVVGEHLLEVCQRVLVEARLPGRPVRSEEHTSELQSHSDLVCRL